MKIRFSILGATLLCSLALALPACAADFPVTNTGDTGAGSLRDAITQANATTDTDTISFAIDVAQANANGVFVITPATALPAITSPVTIRGFSQPGVRVNRATTGINAALKIQLSAPATSNFMNMVTTGLDFEPGSEASAVRGLIINGFVGLANDGTGVLIAANNVRVEGCFIGTDATGTAAAPNGTGVRVSGVGGTSIGGTTTLSLRNLLSGNGAQGVAVQDVPASAPANSIVANLIGTSASGLTALGNGTGVAEANVAPNSGIAISDCTGTLVQNNVIAGNSGIGVIIRQTTTTNPTTGNMVLGNLIGVGADGTTPIGNNGDGVEISSATNSTAGANANVIGATGAGNVLANNSGSGVVIAGNQIVTGTDTDNNTVTANTIASNTMYGILLTGGVGNAFSGNSITNNTLAGIDLRGDGVTANDTGDGDPGPNNLQNFPVITQSVASSKAAIVSGTFNSTPNSIFTIEFFSNLTADTGGNGEGKTFLGSTSVATDTNGNTAFLQQVPLPLSGERVITATATFVSSIIFFTKAPVAASTPTPPGDTSEFSAAFASTAPTESLIVTTTADEDDGTSDPSFGTGTSLREAINYANTNTGSVNTISFDPGQFENGEQTITLAQGQSLPALTRNVTITGPASNKVLVQATKLGAPILTVAVDVTANLSFIDFNGARNSVQNAGTFSMTSGSLSNTVTSLVNTGTATLTNTALSNSRTAIDNSGQLTVNLCPFSNNTTGISTATGATTTVRDSSFFRSTTALVSSGTLSLGNSTLSGNSEGVKVSGGTSTVAQCTFVGNSGSAVTGSAGATLTVNRCTIANNGTGLSTGGAQTTLSNTLLVSNTTNLSGSATRSFNLINSTATRVGLETDGSDHALLKNNGGPTMTVALLPGAPVIDKAAPAISMGTDQRGTGFARVVNGRADIGSFEFGNPAPAKAPTASAAKAPTRKSSAPAS